jgi:hypothetical protein
MYYTNVLSNFLLMIIQAQSALAAWRKGFLKSVQDVTLPALANVGVTDGFLLEVKGLDSGTAVSNLASLLSSSDLQPSFLRSDRNALVRFRRHKNVKVIAHCGFILYFL